MSMQFRYKLAKETFKDKKVPPKDDLNEDHISADQKGNKNFSRKVRVRPGEEVNVKKSRENSLLNLGKEEVSNLEVGKAEKEVSRRDLFSIFNPGTYVDEVQKDQKSRKRKKKTRKKKKKPTDLEFGIIKTEENLSENVPEKSSSGSLGLEEANVLKPSVFRRFWIWLKSIFVKPPSVIAKESTAQETTDIISSISEVTTFDGDKSTEPSEPEINVRVVQTQVDLEREQISNKAGTVSVDQQEGEEDLDTDDPEVNRRNLIRQGLHFFAKPAVENISDKIETVNHSIDKITKRKAVIRPPGAITEKQFLQACTRCDACIHACPKDAIKRAPKSHGFLVMGTPYIEPIKTPCVMCNDLYCISACEDGALKPVRDIFEVSMGYAILDKKHCKAFSNSPCQQCVIDCPVPGAITQNRELQPEFNKNICTGCGVCVRSCHTVNTPVAIKIKPQMVIDNQLLKKKIEREKQGKDSTQKAEQSAATAEAVAEAAARFFGPSVEKHAELDDPEKNL